MRFQYCMDFSKPIGYFVSNYTDLEIFIECRPPSIARALHFLQIWIELVTCHDVTGCIAALD